MLRSNKVAVSMIVGMLAGASSAMTVKENAVSFAQVQAGGDCCCSVMPCMPTCMQTCQPKPLPPVFVEVVPEQIGESIVNIDVLTTHIIHGLRNENPNIPVPEDPLEEHEFVQTVIDPIVIEILAKDLLPQLPVCTYPDGSSFYLDSKIGDVNPESTLPDQNALLKGVIDDLIANGGLNVSTQDHLESLDIDRILEDLTIKDAEGENAIEVLVASKKVYNNLVDGNVYRSEGRLDIDSASLEQSVSDLTDEANADVVPIPEEDFDMGIPEGEEIIQVEEVAEE